MIMYKQRGIALLQALLITFVITIMAIGFTYNARDQVEIADSFASRIEADLKLDSAKSEILYRLTVENMPQFVAGKDSLGWNIYGKPFKLNEFLTVSIQDEAGLYPVNLLGLASDRNWLLALGATQNEAQRAAEAISGLQKQTPSAVGWSGSTEITKRNMQFLEHEFRTVGISEKLISKMVETSTIYPTTYMNPLSMPNRLLPLLYNSDIVTAIIEERNKGNLTSSSLRQITGVTDYDRYFMNIQMSPVGVYKVRIQAVVNEIEVNRWLEIMLLPRSKPYIYILQERNT